MAYILENIHQLIIGFVCLLIPVFIIYRLYKQNINFLEKNLIILYTFFLIIAISLIISTFDITLYTGLIISGAFIILLFYSQSTFLNIVKHLSNQSDNSIYKQRIAELEHANIELDEFAHTVSHDIKEPIRGINHYANFLLEDHYEQLNESATKKINALIDLTEHLDEFVNTLLEYSQVNHLEPKKSEVNLNNIIEKISSTLDFTIKQNNAKIKVDTTLPKIECDPTRITMVFTNLILNAIKYNNKSNKEIEIGTTSITKLENTEQQTNLLVNENTIIYYVKDNGIGIPEEYHSKIFKIFKQSHKDIDLQSGTGIGLAIVKKIIEQHKGKIWVVSIKDVGSTFYFTLNN